MNITLAQTEKLLKGNYTFTQLGFSMMITRLKIVYAGDLSSLPLCTKEINSYLAKFSSAMIQDYEVISKL
ncbi:hypothetical protein LQZ18_04365 [Lachnospiraceae bacterium ZAX-1]